ncbi:MAG: CDP-diacylglycerol--glycerol-3-phosphate 3-phosphatidyltransferase [Pacificimonas sp.]|jgi:CDP-diacylglycerol--glycerol-3-phosphate 3-phosphatidyltransferase/cardiolipin synthase|nr:CDP-diacylglycerol--glycerol-3-phosphate 3-phosphatidyltransferase [Pacificimonas sp.]
MTSLPNLLTLSRILAVPIIVICMWQAGWLGHLIAFVVFSVAGATDYLDGYLARSQGTVSKLGQFLDPIADKIMVAATIIMLIENDIVNGFATIAALIILLREIIVSGLREFLGGVQVSVPVSQLAKWKTTFQMVALGALILVGFSEVKMPFLPAWEVGITCLWIAAIMTSITGYDYLRAGMKHMV